MGMIKPLSVTCWLLTWERCELGCDLLVPYIRGHATSRAHLPRIPRQRFAATCLGVPGLAQQLCRDKAGALVQG